jgi:hypothetical protein
MKDKFMRRATFYHLSDIFSFNSLLYIVTVDCSGEEDRVSSTICQEMQNLLASIQVRVYTLHKSNFLLYQEIENGAVAKSYMRKGF